MDIPLNTQVAMKLQEMADLLEQQGANPFRIRAYRQAAESVPGLGRDLSAILEEEGHKGLVALPNIGMGIATAISEIITTGRWAQLDRLRGVLDPVHLFQTVPGIGPGLAERIHDELHIDTLEALENAAYNGSLEQVKGIGTRRLDALRASLSSMLGRARRERSTTELNGPDVGMLLHVDHVYREKAEADALHRIAPRRFNPKGEAWLPILHIEEGSWHFTAMFSNTALAHQLNRMRDWVVIFFYDDHHQEGQHTVVTETRGPLAGKRVVRGREKACRRHYAE